MRLLKLALLCMVVSALSGTLAGEAAASHGRYFNIAWTETGANTAQFTTTVAYRCTFFFANCPAIGTTFQPELLNYGDGASEAPTFTVKATNPGEDWLLADAVTTHAYSGAGPFKAFISSCCNIGNLNNASGASYTDETLVEFGQEDESARTSVPPIVEVGATGVQTWNVPGIDSGAETLRWRLATAAEACGGCGDPQPAGLSIDPNTGVVTWDTTGKPQGLWFTSVVIESLVGGNVAATTQINYLVRVTQSPNQPPDWTAPTPADGTEFTVGPGGTLTIDLRALDPDGADQVHIDNLGLPPGATFTSTDGNPGTAQFSWIPTAGQLGDYLLTVTAQDDNSPPRQALSRTYTIHVAQTAKADLSLTKSDSPDPAQVGKKLTYTLEVKNNGPDDATGVTVTDNLPAGVTYESATASQGSCSEAGGTVTCTIGSLASGASANVTIEVTPQADGKITNSATVSGGETDEDSSNNTRSEETTVRPPNDPPDCTSVRSDVTKLWPPNHKFHLVRLSGATDPNGDPVTLTVTGVTQDEPVNGAADGNTSPDAKKAGSADKVYLRAERSGTGDGRVYRIAYEVSDPHGAKCSGSVKVGVPHDQGGKATPRDSGRTYDSFGS